MSGSQKPGAKAIPEWQREKSSDAAANPQKGSLESSNKPGDANPGSRAILIEEASRFLEDPEIKHSTMERKIQFLESKGLTNHEIFEMMGIARKEETPTVAEPEEKTEKSDFPEQSTKQTQSHSPISQTPASTAPHADTPPIITYPEFLLHSQKPPPLITAQRLFNTFYVVTAAAATVYGTSKFVIDPMLDSLTTARHSLFETASTNLDTLNEKMEKTVSTVPNVSRPAGIESSSVHDVDADTEATEFFHRSAATQTSPNLTRSNSSLSSQAPQTPASPTTTQSTQLRTLHSQLSSLVPASEPQKPLESRLSEIQTYLGGMAYGGNLQFGKVGGEERDEVSKVKAEIRGVKGVLLSARNFPSGIGTRNWG